MLIRAIVIIFLHLGALATNASQTPTDTEQQPLKQVVLVTGASGGLGGAIADQFSRNPGYRVYGSTRQSKLIQQQAQGKSETPDFTLVLMDPADTGSVSQAIAYISKEAGNIDILVNSAGQMILGSVESIDADTQLLSLLNTNVVGYMRTTAAVLPGMRQKNAGVIINVTSVQAFEPRALQEAYSATRSAVETLSLGQDTYLREKGIRVLVFEPGATSTNIAKNTELGSRCVPGDFATGFFSPTDKYNTQQAFHRWMSARLALGATPQAVAERVVDLAQQAKTASFRTQFDNKGRQRAQFVYGDDFDGEKSRDQLHRKFAIEKKQWADYAY